MQHLRRRSGKGVVSLTGSFLLINPNVTQPAAGPVGLVYIGEALVEVGMPCVNDDLAARNRASTQGTAAEIKEVVAV